MYFAFSWDAGIASRAFDLEHARKHGIRASVTVRTHEVLLRHAIGQQRDEPPLVDEPDVFRAHAFIVDDIAAGKRLAFEVCQRRRITRGECIGHDTQPRAIQKRRRRCLPHARVLGVGRAARLHHLDERLGDELRAAGTFEHHRTGELFADGRDTRRCHLGRQRFRTRDEIGRRWQVGDRTLDGAEGLTYGHAVGGLPFRIHREGGNLNRRHGLEPFAVQVVARAVNVRDGHLGQIDVRMVAEHP